jgi:hypothetical protein
VSHDASVYQYGTPTATSSIGWPTPGSPGPLPHSGYAILPVLIVGVILIAAGISARNRFR